MTVTKKIESKITSFKVKSDEPEELELPKASNVTMMSEDIARPDVLVGSTYKVKVPTSEHAMYVTINDHILNEGTDNEERRPFEMFINSKNMENFQWVVALTRLASAVFRKGGDCTFLVEELKAVYDPKGGFFMPGGVFCPSIVAKLGMILERHLQAIGMMSDEKLDEHQKAFIEAKKAELKAK